MYHPKVCYSLDHTEKNENKIFKSTFTIEFAKRYERYSKCLMFHRLYISVSSQFSHDTVYNEC